MVKPLAFRMRPTGLDEVIGQKHLVGEGKIIRRMVQSKRLQSMILYGPPGIGKTSIAQAIAGSTHLGFRQLNAATDSKKDLQQVAQEAKISGQIVLLLDEIHRLDRTKQDFLLPLLESGSIILIGATTENPYISIHPAIRSRTQIFELHPLDEADIRTAIDRALRDKEKGLGNLPIHLSEEAKSLLSTACNGDLRSTYNALELASLSTSQSSDQQIHLTLPILEECLQRKAISHDAHGDNHYDVISAFQKSIRGSDVNAALHYLARLIEAGELITIARRLLVIAYEDINFGNPAACQRTVAAVDAALQLGLPEARIPLAHAVIDLSLSPKSNSSLTAIDAALADVRQGKGRQVPNQLKDSHYSGAQALNRGIGYRYPHDYPGHFVQQNYLPDDLLGQTYFTPVLTSKYENALNQQLEKFSSGTTSSNNRE